MTGKPAVFLAALVCTALAAPALGARTAKLDSDALRKELERLHAEIAADMDAMEPLVLRLETMSEGYLSASDLEQANAERGTLLAGLKARGDRLGDLHVRLGTLRDAYQIALIEEGGSRLSGPPRKPKPGAKMLEGRKGDPSDLGGGFLFVESMVRFSDQTSSFRTRYHNAMNRDDKEYEAAAAVRRKQRYWQRFAAGMFGAALLVVFLVVGLRRARSAA